MRNILLRRNFLSKKDIQLHFALICLTLMIASSVTIWLLMCAVNHYMIPDGSNSTLLVNSYCVILLVILADAGAAFLITLYFSHKLAGPLFHIERSLAELLDTGTTRPVHIRKNDLLPNLADLVNRVIEGWPRKKKTK